MVNIQHGGKAMSADVDGHGRLACVRGRKNSIESGNAMPEGNKTMRCPITRVLGIVGSFSRNLAGIFLLNPLLTQLLKNN